MWNTKICIAPYGKIKHQLVNVMWGWSGGVMVLGKRPVPGHPTNLK